MKNFCLTPWSRVGFAAAATLLLNACAPGQDTPTPTGGAVTLSRYVAVGDSYTAGISAGGLSRNSQTYSFPNLLAQQFRGASADATFTQPLLDEGPGTGYFDLVDFAPSGLPRIRRVAGNAVRSTIINPSACGGADTVRLLTRSATASTLPQNLGVPGLQLSQIEAVNYGNEATATPGAVFNPYFSRLLPAADSRTYLAAVTTVAASATFFTFFQGLDDLMPYVRSGGTCGIQLRNTADANTADTTLTTNARKILGRLAANGRPGIIARLPTLTTLPFLLQGKGLQLQARLQASFHDTARIYIKDNQFGDAVFITNNDYVLATAILRVGQLTPVQVGTTTLMLPYGRDVRNPLRNADVLNNNEVALIGKVVSGYNVALENLATVYKLPIITTAGLRTLDLDAALFGKVANRISVAGVTYSSEPVRGNFYSLDYYTLTPRGNGLLANAFILAINKAYQANIPFVDINSLPTAAR